MASGRLRNKGDDMERVAYLFMILILILLIAVVFGVLGKGEYQPPTPGEQGRVSSNKSFLA